MKEGLFARAGVFLGGLLVGLAFSQTPTNNSITATSTFPSYDTVHCVHQIGIMERKPEQYTVAKYDYDGDLQNYYPLGKDALQCDENGTYIGDYVPALAAFKPK